MTRRRPNVLISSAGRRVALLEIFRRTLGELELPGRVLACDITRLSSAFQAADAGYVVPRCTDPEFVPRLLQLCDQQDIGLIVPTIDPELAVYAQARDRFEAAGTTVAVSSPEVIHIGGDKLRTHAWLVEQGLPTVRQASVDAVLAAPPDWPYPLLVKPVAGSASIGVAIVRNDAELRAATREGAFIVQTLARGREYTVDVFVTRDGEAICPVPRRRLEVRAGEVSKGMVVRHARLEAVARQVVAAMPGARGALNVQMFHDDASDSIAIIEINARFGGGFPLAWSAGGNYPRWLLEEIHGLASTRTDAPDRDGLVMLRYDHAVFVPKESVDV